VGLPDHLLPPSGRPFVLAALPHARLELLDTGHVLFSSAPAEFPGPRRPFLAEVLPTNPTAGVNREGWRSAAAFAVGGDIGARADSTMELRGFAARRPTNCNCVRMDACDRSARPRWHTGSSMTGREPPAIATNRLRTRLATCVFPGDDTVVPYEMNVHNGIRLVRPLHDAFASAVLGLAARFFFGRPVGLREQDGYRADAVGRRVTRATMSGSARPAPTNGPYHRPATAARPCIPITFVGIARQHSFSDRRNWLRLPPGPLRVDSHAANATGLGRSIIG